MEIFFQLTRRLWSSPLTTLYNKTLPAVVPRATKPESSAAEGQSSPAFFLFFLFGVSCPKTETVNYIFKQNNFFFCKVPFLFLFWKSFQYILIALLCSGKVLPLVAFLFWQLGHCTLTTFLRCLVPLLFKVDTNCRFLNQYITSNTLNCKVTWF